MRNDGAFLDQLIYIVDAIRLVVDSPLPHHRFSSSALEPRKRSLLLVLMGVFAGQYDIVEMRAILACLPAKFEADADGKKAAWRVGFSQRVQSLVAQVRVFGYDRVTVCSYSVSRERGARDRGGGFSRGQQRDGEKLSCRVMIVALSQRPPSVHGKSASYDE